MDESSEQPALHTEVSGVHTLSAAEREARLSHTVRKREECPTTEKNTHIRSPLKLSKSAVTKVQTLSRTNSSCINVTRTLPVTESAWIQHQGQVQPRRTLMAHRKSSTGSLSDVPDMEEMATSPEKAPVTAALTPTSRGITGDKGKNESQSLQLKQGGSGGIDGVR